MSGFCDRCGTPMDDSWRVKIHMGGEGIFSSNKSKIEGDVCKPCAKLILEQMHEITGREGGEKMKALGKEFSWDMGITKAEFRSTALLELAEDNKNKRIKLKQILDDFKELPKPRKLAKAFIGMLENQIEWMELNEKCARISAGESP